MAELKLKNSSERRSKGGASVKKNEEFELSTSAPPLPWRRLSRGAPR